MTHFYIPAAIYETAQVLLISIRKNLGITPYTLQAKPCVEMRPLWKPLFCLEAGTTRKSTAIPNSFKMQAGGIGQSTQGADLCRLLAYMSAYHQPFLFQSRDLYRSQCHRRGANNEKQTLALREPDGRSRERIQIFDETDGGRLEDRLRSDTFRRLAALRPVTP